MILVLLALLFLGLLGPILNLLGSQLLLLIAMIIFFVVFPKALLRAVTGQRLLGGGGGRGGGGMVDVMAMAGRTAWAVAGAVGRHVLRPLGTGTVRLSQHGTQLYTRRAMNRRREDSNTASEFWRPAPGSDGPERSFFS